MGILAYALSAVLLPDEVNTTIIKICIAIFVCIAVFCILVLLAGTVLIIINTLYMSYLIDLDLDYAPNEMTREIHDLYKAAVDGSIALMAQKSGKNYAKTGPGRRQAEKDEAQGNGIMAYSR